MSDYLLTQIINYGAPLFGLVLFVGMLAAPIGNLVRARTADRAIPITLVSGCAGFLVQQFFDNAIFSAGTGVLFAVLLALGSRQEFLQSDLLKKWWVGDE